MNQLNNLNKFLLVVGNARSGTTLLGALLDGLSSVIMANETSASATLWKDYSGEEIIKQIFFKAENDYKNNRPSEGYEFAMGTSPLNKKDVRVIGDKIFNPALIFLLGDHKLIPSLEERLKLPLFFINSNRNPFDVIATMHLRSGAPISNRIRWYFMHCEAIEGIHERVTSSRFLHSYHEGLLLDTENTMNKIYQFLDLPVMSDYLQCFKDYLFKEPKSTRNSVSWTKENIDAVYEGINRFSYLSRYTDSRFQP
jgi:hypothetical protein